MFAVTTSRITRHAPDGIGHTVEVRRLGQRRWVQCRSCGWEQNAQFLAWPKAREHLSGAHDARGQWTC
jgi:hypothetical protein